MMIKSNGFAITRRGFISVAAASAAALAAPAVVRAQSSSLVVRLDFAPWGFQAGMHLADVKGWFREAGLNVEVQDGRGSANTLQLVNAGQVDVGQISAGLMPAARQQGATVKCFSGIIRGTDLAVLVDQASPIRSVTDFKGKRLVVFAASPWAPFIDYWLSKGGLTRADIELMFVDPAALWGTYSAGKADGIMTTSISVLPAMKDTRPSRAIMASEVGVNFPSYGLIATDKAISQRAEALRALASIQRKTWDYIIAGNIDEAVDALLAKRPDANLDREIQKGQIKESIALFDTPASKGKPIGWQADDDWRACLASLEAAGAITSGAVPAQSCYTNHLVVA